MYYSIRHVTRFLYSAPIAESHTEVRKRPVSDGRQTCLSFALITAPEAPVFSYLDSWGNTVHHFTIVKPHRRMEVVSEAVVEQIERPVPTVEDFSPADWAADGRFERPADRWHYLHESKFIHFSDDVRQFAANFCPPDRDHSPFAWLLRLNEAIYHHFKYMPNVTRVDSPVEEILHHEAGVCQDFSHLMLALVRLAGLPARYISGYLYHRSGHQDRSAEDASHAWVEVWLPRWGWTGFDPTNNLLVKQRHLPVAAGRDYGDVPPTRGIFTGQADSELDVSVTVLPIDKPVDVEPGAMETTGWAAAPPVALDRRALERMQQQQQQ